MARCAARSWADPPGSRPARLAAADAPSAEARRLAAALLLATCCTVRSCDHKASFSALDIRLYLHRHTGCSTVEQFSHSQAVHGKSHSSVPVRKPCKKDRAQACVLEGVAYLETSSLSK
eukprot:363625-Chlamydomonas_euryale.AAC.25